jgi:hypothetical protein
MFLRACELSLHQYSISVYHHGLLQETTSYRSTKERSLTQILRLK